MAQIEWYAADSVYDPLSHAQGVKVTAAQTLLFIAGQVAFATHGDPAHQTQVAIAALGRPEWLIEVEAIAVP